MAKDTFRVVTRGVGGDLRIRDYDNQEALLKRHSQVGVDEWSTDLGLRGLPVFRGLSGPMREGSNVIRYESREVTTGLVGSEQQTEVVAGLEEGERVVVSGQFLLDSESQLQEAVQKLLEARLEAKSGAKKAPKAHDHGGREDAEDTLWTCPMHPMIVEEGPGICPICGMDLVEKRRGAAAPR